MSKLQDLLHRLVDAGTYADTDERQSYHDQIDDLEPKGEPVETVDEEPSETTVNATPLQPGEDPFAPRPESGGYVAP